MNIHQPIALKNVKSEVIMMHNLCYQKFNSERIHQQSIIICRMWSFVCHRWDMENGFSSLYVQSGSEFLILNS